MEKTRKNKGLYMILSVLIAIGLWMYVVKVLNPDSSGTVHNLPVTFTGLNVLEDRGLMISTGMDQTVTLSVIGKRNALNLLSAETVGINIDVSSIDQPGQYTQPYQVSFNLSGEAAASSLAVTDRHPQNVTFSVVRQAMRKVPIRGTSAGSVADGYQIGEFSFSPETIEVRGEDSLVNQIEYALVTVNQENMSATYSGDLPYTFIGYDGQILDGANLVTDVPLVRTVLPVYRLKEVPLSVNLLPGGGATEKHVKYEIFPETIIVSGEEEDLEPLKEISLGDIDLSKVLGSDTLTFSIPLAAELTNVSGVTEAKVTISVEGLTTALLEVDNIELINTPVGYQAHAVTQTRQIQIRGPEDAVQTVTASQLRIVADLEKAVAATGTQTIPVKVYLDGRSDVGVVGEYNIVISISRG